MRIKAWAVTDCGRPTRGAISSCRNADLPLLIFEHQDKHLAEARQRGIVGKVFPIIIEGSFEADDIPEILPRRKK
jgi:hypothetical protein